MNDLELITKRLDEIAARADDASQKGAEGIDVAASQMDVPALVSVVRMLLPWCEAAEESTSGKFIHKSFAADIARRVRQALENTHD